MAEIQQNLVKLLNPWTLHLQKLGLELKCPLCICIPRSTQFGPKCPVCKNHCADRDIRPAPYMENLVSIYQSLDATFTASSLHILSPEQALVSVTPPSIDNVKKETSRPPEGGVCPVKIDEQSQGSSDHACDKHGIWSSKTPENGAALGNEQNKEQLHSSGWKGSIQVLETEEIDVNQVPQLSSESHFGSIAPHRSCIMGLTTKE